MSREQTVGIVGGYGRAGTVVAQQLARKGAASLLIGGRRRDMAEDLARSLGGGALAQAVDVYDHAALVDFSRRCRVVVNCSSPASHVMERVARGAIEGGAHYVDLSGGQAIGQMGDVDEKARQQELCCVLSAGWAPGMLEMFVRHVIEPLEALDELCVYVQDRTEWSQASSIDVINMIFDLPYGEYRNGQWAKCEMSDRRSYDFGPPFGPRMVIPREWHELEELSRKTGARRVAVLLPADAKVLGFQWVVKRLFHGREDTAASIMRRIVRLDVMLNGSSAMIRVEGTGTIGGRRERRTGTVQSSGDSYHVSAVPAAIAARWILEKRITRPGVTYLGNSAPTPSAFMEEVREAGISFTTGG